MLSAVWLGSESHDGRGIEKASISNYHCTPSQDLLNDWTKEVLRHKPRDITSFSRDYFTALEAGAVEEFLEELPKDGLRVPKQTDPALDIQVSDSTGVGAKDDKDGAAGKGPEEIVAVSSAPKSRQGAFAVLARS